MDEKDIDLLLEICDLYRDITWKVGAECKLDASAVEDRLARIRDGELVICSRDVWDKLHYR